MSDPHGQFTPPPDPRVQPPQPYAPQPYPPQSGPPQPYPPQFGAPPWPQQPPVTSQYTAAIMSAVLGCLGVAAGVFSAIFLAYGNALTVVTVFGMVCSPVGWVLSSGPLKRGEPRDRGPATVGRITGMIGTGLCALVLLVFVLYAAFLLVMLALFLAAIVTSGNES